MTLRKKLLITIACLSVILCTLVTGTIAWLTDETTSIKNEFAPSTINIELAESENLDLQMVPGATIKKDPVVTVTANSEACYLFVQINENLGAWNVTGKDFKDYLTYTVAAGWTPLDGYEGVYYRTVSTSGNQQDFHVLADDQVTVGPSVTKGMMDMLYNQDGSVNEEVLPTLTFTAYACQREGFDSAAAAWTEITTNP